MHRRVARKDRTIMGFSSVCHSQQPCLHAARPTLQPLHSPNSPGVHMRVDACGISLFCVQLCKVDPSITRKTDSFCMSCIYVHNDAFHCRHFPRKFLRAIIFNIHHQHQHNRGIRGRGFVTIGHKTSEAAPPPPTKPSSFITSPLFV